VVVPLPPKPVEAVDPFRQPSTKADPFAVPSSDPFSVPTGDLNPFVTSEYPADKPPNTFSVPVGSRGMANPFTAAGVSTPNPFGITTNDGDEGMPIFFGSRS
jgi:hypothetical protein